MCGTKHDLLTDQDVRQYVLPRRVLAVLDECGRYFDVTRSKLRVLDWGCGRGMTVAKLLEMGFDAYGVDVDPEPIQNGRPLFLSRGYDPDERLKCIRADDCRTSFAEGFFHVVLSDQVFEHLPKLDAVASEVARVTMLGGKGLHTCPAKMALNRTPPVSTVHPLAAKKSASLFLSPIEIESGSRVGRYAMHDRN